MNVFSPSITQSSPSRRARQAQARDVGAAAGLGDRQRGDLLAGEHVGNDRAASAPRCRGATIGGRPIECENRLASTPPLPARATSSVAIRRQAHRRRRAAECLRIAEADQAGVGGLARRARAETSPASSQASTCGAISRSTKRRTLARKRVALGALVVVERRAVAHGRTSTSGWRTATWSPARTCSARDRAGVRRAQLVLHLHRLDDDQQGAGRRPHCRARRSAWVTRPCSGATRSPRRRAAARLRRAGAASTAASSRAFGEPASWRRRRGRAAARTGAPSTLAVDLAAGRRRCGARQADDAVRSRRRSGRRTRRGVPRRCQRRGGAVDLERHDRVDRRRRRPAAPRAPAGLARQQGERRGGERLEPRRRRRRARAARRRTARRGTSVVASPAANAGWRRHAGEEGAVGRARRGRRSRPAPSASCATRRARLGAWAISLPSIES